MFNLESVFLQWQKWFTNEKYLRQLPIFPGEDIEASSAHGQTMKGLEELKKKEPSYIPSPGLSLHVRCQKYNEKKAEPVFLIQAEGE